MEAPNFMLGVQAAGENNSQRVAATAKAKDSPKRWMSDRFSVPEIITTLSGKTGNSG
jgi:hypothetical protein